MYDSGRDNWAKELRERRPDVPMATIERYLHNLYRVQPDFVYSVSREFAKSCQTPTLPDDVVAHPLQVSIASPRWRRMPRSRYFPGSSRRSSRPAPSTACARS
jgi:hypothetical protein